MRLSPDGEGGGGLGPASTGSGSGGSGSSGGVPAAEAALVARGQRSVRLRGQAGDFDDEGPSLDPASKSLADALKVLFALLQVALVAIGALYIFSGFQNVREGQVGVGLLFGKISQPRLEPGFQFTMPYPVGELVRVETGTRTLKLDGEFWPGFANPADRDRPLDDLPRAPELKPETDGSLITADGNIVHARWQVEYRRDDAPTFAQRIEPTIEESLVRSVVVRGIVMAVSETTIDDLLTQSDGDQASVATRATQIAQDMLSRNRSGIVIDRVKLEAKMPPLYVRASFQNVQTAAEQAAKRVEEARQEARRRLNETAGEASSLVLAEIDRYELALEKRDEAAMASALERVVAVLENRQPDPAIAPPPADGSLADQLVGVRASGNVARLLADAELYRTSVVNDAKADLAFFEAKLAQYQDNPKVVVHRAWTDAYRALMASANVESFFLSPEAEVVRMQINRDPTEKKARAKQQNIKETERTEQERMELMDRDRFKTKTGIEEKSAS
ncbi:MAG: SPFH domain-containing protein [Planctomycetota bacterium]|nr:SPFH domain-containing protein [Planctomycetota bacterium]